MRPMPINKPPRPRADGFTLVEILVIAPIILLVISGIVAIIVTVTGDVLTSNARSQLLQNLQSGYDQIEADVRTATSFRDTSFAAATPQGPNNSASPASFTTLSTSQTLTKTALIIRKNATTKNPLDPTRNIVYSGSPTCTTAYNFDIVYYFRYNGTSFTDGSTWSLWRRVIADPSATPCTTPWQRSSCMPGQTGTPCSNEDQRVIANLAPTTGLKIYYLNSPDSSNLTTEPDTIDQIYPTAATPIYDGSAAANNIYNPFSQTGQAGTSARSIRLEFTARQTVAGRQVTANFTAYASRP